MRLPVIRGLIRRRVLINFRADPEAIERYLPAPFRPKLFAGHAIASICLIRLEQIRPRGLPRFLGIASENAAHRIAVVWDEPSGEQREGVFIPMRHTGSLANHFAGGRLFPGENRLARFEVRDDGDRVAISINGHHDGMAIEVRGQTADSLPDGSCFPTLTDASAFIQHGNIGYSVTRDCCRFDGMRLAIDDWRVQPLAVDHVHSSFFADERVFPAGSIVFDHALLMRNISHEWRSMAEMAVAANCRAKHNFVDAR